MKQQITQQQYNSLSTQSKSKYAQWIVDNGKKHGIHRVEYDIGYWTIDNMILFIDDHIEEGWWNIEREGDKKGWRVQSKYIGFDENDVPELIDALWSAVKVLLEEDDERSMKGQYRPFNDGWGIVGYSYICPQCGHETMFANCKDGCEKCGFSEEYVDPDEWYEEQLKIAIKDRA